MGSAKVLIYQLYPLAWSGIREMTAFLPRIEALGADFVWLSPIYPSPRYDMGYDVADYYGIDYRLGTMEDFDEFVRTAHMLGLKVIMDLVLNHTSTEHAWFHAHPEYYIWDKCSRPGWKNLFNQGSAWQLYAPRGKYYCHLFHEKQADLNWFHLGVINRSLIEEFRTIMAFWMYVHDVDGFRLDAPQALNKKLNKDELEFKTLLKGERAALIINMLSHISGKKTPFLMMECFDPTFGSIVDYYTKETDVEFVTNAMLKSTATRGALGSFRQKLDAHAKNPRYVLELESHDSPRFTSRTGLSGFEILDNMFSTEARTVCLYQGQELGLKNPTREELPDAELLALDAQSAMQFAAGASLESLRETSRANARVRLPLDEYTRQEKNPCSTLNKAKQYIETWRVS